MRILYQILIILIVIRKRTPSSKNVLLLLPYNQYRKILIVDSQQAVQGLARPVAKPV